MFTKNKLTRSVFYCYLPIIIIFVVIRILSSYGYLKFLGVTGTYLVNAGIQVILMFSIPVFLFSAINKNKIKDTLKFYNFKKISLSAILISIAIGFIVYVLNVYTSSFFSSLLSELGYRSSSSSVLIAGYPFWLFLVNIFVTAVLPAICEETAHRGMLLKGLSPVGRISAIVLSSILFGLLHLNIEQTFYTILIGFLLGYIVSVCDNIYPAIIIHFMNNALSVTMGYSAHHNLGLDYLFDFVNKSMSNNSVIGMLFFITFIGTLVILLRYLIKRLFRETALKNINKLQSELMKEITKENFIKEIDDIFRGIKSSERKDVVMNFQDFHKLYQDKSFDIGNSSNLDKKIMSDYKPYRMDVVTKVLLIASFALTFAVTLLTFIWGVI